MPESNMSFAVNENAVICNILDGEIRGRLSKNSSQKQLYREKGIIDSTPVITNFMLKHRNIFGNPKLIHRNGNNFFSGIMPLSSLSKTESYKDKLKSRMKYEYDLTDTEISGMDEFLEDFEGLKSFSEIRKIVKDTETYKNSIENAWRLNESSIMKYVKGVLGYEPQKIGKVRTYIVYPTFNTHRCYQLSSDKTLLFFGKRNETDINKILAYLAHQAVHQPMLPYKNSMTRKEKDLYHGFIKFLTDKDVYYQLSGNSYLDIVTEGENAEIMGRIYPFWLGYRYRNAHKEGLNSEVEIAKAIKRDKTAFDMLPQDSKRKKLYSTYEFEKLDPKKISVLFRENRGINPYQFSKLDFDDKSKVYQDRYLKNSPDNPDFEGR